MLSKKIETNKAQERKLIEKIKDLKEFMHNPEAFISRSLILEKDILGIKTKFFEDLNVATTLFELLYHNKS